MSVIGPRPTLRYQVERYSERQRKRLDVLPGITGWAQIHGRASLSWDERIELDVWYVEHRSPLTDLLILLRTPLALFGGTYKGETGGWRLTDRPPRSVDLAVSGALLWLFAAIAIWNAFTIRRSSGSTPGAHRLRARPARRRGLPDGGASYTPPGFYVLAAIAIRVGEAMGWTSPSAARNS